MSPQLVGSSCRGGLVCKVFARAASGFGVEKPTVRKDLQVPKKLPTVTMLDWKRPLEVVKYPDPRLRAVNSKVGVFDQTLLTLAKEMIEVMYEDDGVGLAAPQVGVNIRLMVFNPEGRTDRGQESILVNPEIISTSKEIGLKNEGCLSFPSMRGVIERYQNIVIKAQNEKGEPVQLQLEDKWIARIFQHEYDHLQGILFHDRMKPDVLETVRAELVAREDAFAAANPGVPIQRVAPPKVNKGF